jgi:hypothetical protein
MVFMHTPKQFRTVGRLKYNGLNETEWQARMYYIEQQQSTDNYQINH